MVDVVPIDACDHIARLEPSLIPRTARLNLADQRAVRNGQSEGLRQLLLQVLHMHADTAAQHLAVLQQLILDVQGDVDGNRERHAHITAGAAVDLGVDAHHFTVDVEQWAAGIAGVYRRIGLNEGHVVIAAVIGQRPTGGADDPCRHRTLEAERRSDRYRPLAGLDLRGIAEAHHGQAGGRNLDQRHIAALVDTDDLGCEFTTVIQSDDHLGCIGDDMRIGQHISVRADDEARTDAAAGRRVLGTRRGHVEAAEKLRQGIIAIG